tara:strand:+ start:144 stop:620 length:477 start_codon:yes stop_codon:yes gene_type:complete
MKHNLEKHLRLIAKALIQEMQRNIVAEKRVASKDLLNSFEYEITDEGILITNKQEYSGNVDLGRRPGLPPPISKIIRWMDQKRIRGRSRESGRFMRKRDSAFYIARKIGDLGYPGINYVSKSLGKFKDIIALDIGEAYVKDLETMLQENISKFDLNTN